MRWLIIVCTVALGACLQPAHTVCENGNVCPAEHVCGPNGGCASPEQLRACDGATDGTVCETRDGTGLCQDQICVLARCGNDVEEIGEVCDDGNQFGGDGCNGTCTSDESCGNGILELDEECDCGSGGDMVSPLCMSLGNDGPYCNAVCDLRRCGNTVVDPGEVCDDGNTMPGDGCNFDCTSDEVCGNSVTDFFRGEQCDDGNTRATDGCASCQLEEHAWKVPTLDDAPAKRAQFAAAYDVARQRLVMFGGSDQGAGELRGDTWELAGDVWIRREFVDPPRQRWGHAMAYDSKRGRVVLFAGSDANPTNETWEYDGFEWRRLSLTTSPPARLYHAMAYDAKRDRMVLFGGDVNGTAVDDTWELDGSTWTQRQPANKPSARALHAMAFDPTRGGVVLHGGNTADGDVADTYLWTGTTWTQVTTTGAPSARASHSLTFDDTRGGLLLHGGVESIIDAVPFSDTYVLVGNAWSVAPDAGQARFAHAAVYDTARRRTVIMGGSETMGGAIIPLETSITMQLTTSWTEVQPPSQQPVKRQGARIVYDEARGRVRMFGGLGEYPQTFQDTWEHDGMTWRDVNITGPLPPSRLAHNMAYDSKRRVTVLFGGIAVDSSNVVTRFDDTWELAGSTWTHRTNLATSPPARNEAAMAFDAARGRMVMFGGFGTTLLAETWEYDGTTWIQRSPTNNPGARIAATAVYDSKRQRVVVFGGSSATGARNDMWEWDGTDWTERAISGTRPTGRFSHGMSYDAARDVIVVFGGSDGTSESRDTWELVDGVTWHDRTQSSGPPRAFDAQLAYDALERQTVMVQYPVVLTDVTTWLLEATDLQLREVCTSTVDYDHDMLAGCADDDCWSTCSPECPPDAPPATCPMTPRCGDGVCTAVETCRTCAADCPTNTAACPRICGDEFCDAGEMVSSCPGDCS